MTTVKYFCHKTPTVTVMPLDVFIINVFCLVDDFYTTLLQKPLRKRGTAPKLAAWLGLVPRQVSTGGKPKLLGISKRGNPYLRTLLIHGARAVLYCVKNESDKYKKWVMQLKHREHGAVANVGLANKLARIAWALVSQKTVYSGTAM